MLKEEFKNAIYDDNKNTFDFYILFLLEENMTRVIIWLKYMEKMKEKFMA